MQTDSYIQWYNDNEGRHYPLAEVATGVSDDGRSMPTDIIADMGVLVSYVHGTPYISSLRLTSRLATVGVSSAASGLMVGTYLRTSIEPYKAYPLTPVTDDVTGWIVFGNHIASGQEDYRFASPGQSKLERRVVRVIDPPPVVKLLKWQGRSDHAVDGVVRMRGGAGILIEQDATNPQKIIVRLAPGLKHAMAGPCNEVASEDACGVPPMRSWNGVCPDEDGLLTLRFE